MKSANKFSMQITYLYCSLCLLDLDSVPPQSSKIEILAKIVNGLNRNSCKNHLLLMQKAQSWMFVGFLHLPLLMNRLQHKNLYILGSSKPVPECEEIFI